MPGSDRRSRTEPPRGSPGPSRRSRSEPWSLSRPRDRIPNSDKKEEQENRIKSTLFTQRNRREWKKLLSSRRHQGQSGGGAEECQLENKQGLAGAQYRSLGGQQDGVRCGETPAVQVEKKFKLLGSFAIFIYNNKAMTIFAKYNYPLSNEGT